MVCEVSLNGKKLNRNEIAAVHTYQNWLKQKKIVIIPNAGNNAENWITHMLLERL